MLTGEAIKMLRDYFDLNLYEARVYVAVLRGASTARDVAKMSGVPLPRVYDTLDSLERIGLVISSESVVKPADLRAAIKNKVIEMESIFRREHEARLREGSKLLRILSKVSKEKREGNDVLILRGIGGIAAKMLEACEKSSNIVFTVRKGIKIKERLKPYLEALTPRRRRIRFLLHSSVKLGDDDVDFLRRIGAKAAFSEGVMLDLLVADGREAIIGLPAIEEGVIAIWIRQESFTKSLMESVKELWESASKKAPTMKEEAKVS